MDESLMRRRLWQFQVLLLAIPLAALIAVTGRSLAQIRNAEQAAQNDGDDRRLERRMELLQRNHDELRLNIETRLTRIEVYIAIGSTLLGAITLGLLGQIGARLLGVIANRPKGP